MTPAEQKLMGEVIRASLREELDPMKKDVEGIKGDIGSLKSRAGRTDLEIQKLKEVDRNHSGKYNQVKAELPRMQSQTEEQIAIAREDSERGLGAAATAYERLSDVVGVMIGRMAGIEGELVRYRKEADARALAASMKVPDGKGGQELKPASLLAAESAHRNEVSTDLIAVDTKATAQVARSNLKLQKWMTGLAGLAAFLEALRHIIAAITAATH